jgi:hypothetical protein
MRRNFLASELKGIQGESDFLRLQRIMEKGITLKHGVATAVTDESNEILAALFYLIGRKHIIYLNAVSSPAGKEKHAMTLLIDHILKQLAGSDKIFDFEGSMIPGVARYYKGFGAVEVQYPVIMK